MSSGLGFGDLDVIDGDVNGRSGTDTGVCRSASLPEYSIGQSPGDVPGLGITELPRPSRAGQFAAFTPAFNMSGQPAINLPLHRNADGLPIGIQLAAGYGREDVLIRVAAQLESAHPWASFHPAVS